MNRVDSFHFPFLQNAKFGHGKWIEWRSNSSLYSVSMLSGCIKGLYEYRYWLVLWYAYRYGFNGALQHSAGAMIRRTLAACSALIAQKYLRQQTEPRWIQNWPIPKNRLERRWWFALISNLKKRKEHSVKTIPWSSLYLYFSPSSLWFPSLSESMPKETSASSKEKARAAKGKVSWPIWCDEMNRTVKPILPLPYILLTFLTL